MSASLMQTAPAAAATGRPCRVCSYEDRADAMDSLILMGESLCRADPLVSLHLTVPDAPEKVKNWAQRRPQVTLLARPPEGVRGWDVKPSLLLEELNSGSPQALWLDDDMIVSQPVSELLAEFPADALIVAEEWDRPGSVHVSQFWGMRRRVRVRSSMPASCARRWLTASS